MYTAAAATAMTADALIPLSRQTLVVSVKRDSRREHSPLMRKMCGQPADADDILDGGV